MTCSFSSNGYLSTFFVFRPKITYSPFLKIREVIGAQGIRVYTPPIDPDDENADHARVLIDAMPFSIIGSTEDVKSPDGRIVKGREYIWGVAEGISLQLASLPYADLSHS